VLRQLREAKAANKPVLMSVLDEALAIIEDDLRREKRRKKRDAEEDDPEGSA